MSKKYRYGRKILITGASSGIGLACARMFASRGYDVIAVSRKAGGDIERIGNGSLTPCAMDVTRPETYCALDSYLDDVGIIVHCAGFGIAGAAEDTPMDMVRRQMEINYFGILSLNSYVLPHMRNRGSGLVMVIGSIAGRVSIPFQSHYSSTKFALEAYIEGLRIECRPYGIRAVVIEPGDTRTGFTANRVWNDAPSVYRERCRVAVSRMEKDEMNGKPPESVARVAYALAGRKNPPIRVAVGMSYKLLMMAKRLLPSRFVEWIVSKLY
ncbi:SDR family NAD(P)-dependent oxidoreductase [Parasphaerochaeta coccoides]|uniref:Short-chain dehydrogenase/reductase SDR n=1 Tax=Parasphaerochaeta coccoides (strain ATCC BAA-1237 / DSM 17374 / SPN1) TaxID=760011 RepID=F4GK32_PARC1|nr:SDR family NAD(P)-dependent oxidoreductase [Parasphaerochaeta coccoides]AEC01804.1 short-chain dehydrogenase/reductase SDR [Parasphaerochaeta coccoides DSM 17374]